MLTHTFIRGWQSGAGALVKRIQVTGEAELNLDLEVAVGNNQLVAFALDVSQLKGLFLVADGALTVETNSGGSPVNTITLAADAPFTFVTGETLRDTAGTAITTDITALYLTNATAAPVNFSLRAIYDPTV